MDQMNIFQALYDELPKWDKSLSLIEMYGGIGSQLKALKNLNINIDKHYLVEVDIDATISYASIHCNLNNVIKNYNFPAKEEMLDYLIPFNWWSNDKPKDIKRLKLAKLQQLYVSQKLTNNFGDVFQLNDLPQVDMITWSTPCQDFSLAGKQKGFDGKKGGLTFITLELFKKLKQRDKLPTFLLFENVPALMSSKFIHGFNVMRKELDDLGFQNITMRLNAKNYGIPQNRDRVFILSVKKEYYKGFRYDEPKPIKLDLKLKDMLEGEVDKKYYLSDEQIEKITNWNGCISSIEKNETNCINSKVNGKQPSLQDRIYSENGIMTAITTGFLPSVAIKEKTKKGYSLATNGDGVYLDRPHQKRGVVQKGMIPALKTSGNDIGVVVESNIKNVNNENGIMSTLGTNCGSSTSSGGGVVAVQIQPKDREYNKKCEKRKNTFETRKDNLSNAILTNNKKNMILNNLQIRKLTPLECWRLMGFDDEDYYKAKKSISNSQLYKQAGNSIVVHVLMAIFKNLF